MVIIFFIVMLFFWFLLLFYSLLTVVGLWQRIRYKHPIRLKHYPSVAVLIPAHNEAVVIENTIRAMARLKYPGKLDVYLLDDNSQDGTGEIVKEFSETFSHLHYISVPPGGPKGKSRVLNYGLKISKSTYFVVYDADNQPEPDAVTKLVEVSESTKNAAGAVGYVKTINADKNMLTSMIGLEFQIFQLLMQCGRWGLIKLGSLAGTNMLLNREILEGIGGYDVHALAEDAELTIRLTAFGYRIPVVHVSRTWEQEPEKLKTFIKQRTRWLIGNIYLLEKSLRDISHWKGKTFALSLQHLLTYLVFILLLLFSDVFFILGVLGYSFPEMQVPMVILWFMSYVIYTAQLLSALVIDGNVTFKNVLYVLIMYFTYAQLFIILLVRGFVMYLWSRLRNKTIGWDKTQRYSEKDKAS